MWTIVVAILALGLTALLPLAFTIRKRELGPNPARDERLRSILEIVIVVLVVLLAAIGCFRGLADPWRSPALAGMVWITTIASIVHSVRERRGAGAVLLELGRPPEARMSLAATAVAAVALALMAVADFSDQRGVGLQTLSRMAVGLAIVTGSAYSYAVGWRHEIREHGFVVLRLLSWGQIRDYRWEGKTAAGQSLRLLRRRPIFLTRSVAFEVPSMHRDAVERLLLQHLPARG